MSHGPCHYFGFVLALVSPCPLSYAAHTRARAHTHTHTHMARPSLSAPSLSPSDIPCWSQFQAIKPSIWGRLSHLELCMFHAPFLVTCFSFLRIVVSRSADWVLYFGLLLFWSSVQCFMPCAYALLFCSCLISLLIFMPPLCSVV